MTITPQCLNRAAILYLWEKIVWDNKVWKLLQSATKDFSLQFFTKIQLK